MTSRSESARNVIRVNATSIDVTSSNTITFGYVNEWARAGRVIAGRYRLHCPLPAPAGKKPSGACSSLWRADTLGRGRSVMVELLDHAIAEDPSLADLFVDEARAAAAVASPFVSRVLDFGVEASTPYLVTETGVTETGVTETGVTETGVTETGVTETGVTETGVTESGVTESGVTETGVTETGVTETGVGVTLAARIAAHQRPSHGELVRIVGELAQALDAMHAVDVLHRDLRSERVHLWSARTPAAPEREVTKLSFGISKLMNDTLELVRTMAHRAVGPAESPQYSSPEQVLGTTPLGPRSDLWSLAVIVFECVTGELPFVGATMGERLVQICSGPARVPSEVCSVPRGFDDWFARGVRKAPAERWASAREMANALATLLARENRK